MVFGWGVYLCFGDKHMDYYLEHFEIEKDKNIFFSYKYSVYMQGNMVLKLKVKNKMIYYLQHNYV